MTSSTCIIGVFGTDTVKILIIFQGPEITSIPALEDTKHPLTTWYWYESKNTIEKGMTHFKHFQETIPNTKIQKHI